MKKPCKAIAASTVLLISSFVFSLPANADPENVLDSIVVTGKDFSIATSDGETFTQQFGNVNADLIDCEAVSDGTFCINDGTNGHEIVDLSEFGNPLFTFTCESAGFEAKGNRSAQCSAIAVEDENTLHIAGILNKNGSAIVICVKNPETGEFECDPLIQDRPPIVDLDRVPEGLLYVEDKNSVVLLTGIDSAGAPTPTTVAVSRDFSLAKGRDKEEILDVAQVASANGDVQYAITTSFGRLIAFNSVLGVVTIIDEVCLLGPDNCGGSSALSFDVAQNAERGGPIYALVSNDGSGNGSAGSVTAYSNAFTGGMFGDPLSSVATSIGNDDFNGIFLSVFEGQNINLGGCNPNCPVGNFANLFYNLLGEEGTATAWEITGIPHCAWIPDECVEPLEETRESAVCSGKDPQECMCDESVLRLVGNTLAPTTCADALPGLLEFNVTPVLPPNLVAKFDVDPFPPLWMPPAFQAQPVNGHFFKAILMDAGDNQSSELPELVVDDFDPPAYNCPADGPDSPLQSSMVLRLRERAATCDAGTGVCDESIGSAITYACTSTRSRGCCSLFPLDTMLALFPPAQTIDGDWYIDSGTITIGSTTLDDSAAAKFVDSHFEALEDFEYAACNDVDSDPNGLEPLDLATCDQLEQRRLNAQQKLINALSNTAAGTGNCSQQSANYQSFVSQIENYITEAESYEGNLPACSDGDDNDGVGGADNCDLSDNNADGFPDSISIDRAARVQALVAHAHVLSYAVNEILIPTIPGSANCDDGWDEQDVDASGVPIWITN